MESSIKHSAEKSNYRNRLVKTKLFMPQLKKDLVARPRLSKLFEQGHLKKLLFLQAPAGYGKTTAIVEWLSQSKQRSAWYSIDSNDNDITRFLSYIACGLEQVQPGIHQSLLHLLDSTEPPPTDLLLTLLINDFNELNQDTILVLDDYHLITKNEIHDAFLYIIQHLPPQLQIIVISRAELPFSISMLRVDGDILELDLIDLKFTVQETETFINDVLRLDLPQNLVSQLEKRTDGWVSGLQLAAMGMRSQNNTDEFIHHLSGNDRLIANYLVDQVLAHIPPSTYDFLLSTSPLDRFCPDLCNALLNINTSHEIIEKLEQCNSFIIPLDHQQTWYRYHHLFADLLQQRLARQDQDKAQQIHKTASIWHEQYENFEEAIDYSLKAHDNNRVADLLNRSVKTMILHGRSEKVIAYLKALPIELLQSKKNLWVYLILALLDRGAFREANFQLERIWGNLESIKNLSPADKNLVKGFSNCFHAAINIHTALNAEKASELTKEAQQLFHQDEYTGLCIAFGHFGSANLHMGNVTQAAKALDQAILHSQKTNYDLLYLLWFSYRAHVDFKTGHLVQAKKLFDQAAEYAAVRGLNMSNVFINAIIGLGCIYYEWDDMETAHTYLLEGVKLAEFGENIDRLVFAYAAYFRYLIFAQDFDKAREKLEKLKKMAAIYHHPPVILGRIEALEIELALAENDSDLHNTVVFGPQIPSEEMNALYEEKWFAIAKMLAAEGEIDRAIDIAKTFLKIAQEQDRDHSVITLNILLALLNDKAGLLTHADLNLTNAIQMAEPHHYFRVFIDHDMTIKPMLERLLQHNSPLSKYIQRILKAIDKQIDQTSNEQSIKKSVVTNRELEVIHLLAVGLSYIEIADKMQISINTLKTYIKNIYHKLNIHNKVEAINRAKELNLL